MQGIRHEHVWIGHWTHIVLRRAANIAALAFNALPAICFYRCHHHCCELQARRMAWEKREIQRTLITMPKNITSHRSSWPFGHKQIICKKNQWRWLTNNLSVSQLLCWNKWQVCFSRVCTWLDEREKSYLSVHSQSRTPVPQTGPSSGSCWSHPGRNHSNHLAVPSH